MKDREKDRPDKREESQTSGNREESMTESDKDAFGRSTSSGTESLGGEARGNAERKSPGGVEGESGQG
jgi:hypothetical protein